MNLRTITFWALYQPDRNEIIAMRKFKYLVERLHHPVGSVVVKLKGHYLRRPDGTTNTPKDPKRE